MEKRYRDGQEDALSYIFGISAQCLLRASLTQHSPLLLLGEAGVGKTSLITVILQQLYEQNSTMQVAFLDEVDQIASKFARREQTSIAIRGHTAFRSSVFFHHLILQMQERVRSRQKAERGDQHAYRLLIIDEFLWMQQDEKLFLEPLRQLVSLLREEPTLQKHYGLIASSHCGDRQTNQQFPHQFLFRSTDYPGLATTDALVGPMLEQGQFLARPENILCHAPKISPHT